MPRQSVSRPEREFHIMQFHVLKTEILELRKRVVQILSLGITGIPLIIGAGEQFDLDLVIFASPLITVAFTLMLLYEQNSIMRAGRYIRRHIEPNVGTKAMIGWERFLETEPGARRAEQLFSFAAYLIVSIYYIGGSGFAYIRLADRFNDSIPVLVTAAYVGGFFTALYLVITNFPTGTTTPGESA